MNIENTAELPKIIKLPEREEMFKRLTSVDGENNLLLQKYLYPLILEYAGQEKTPDEIFKLLSDSFMKFSKGRPIMAPLFLYIMRMEKYLQALSLSIK